MATTCQPPSITSNNLYSSFFDYRFLTAIANKLPTTFFNEHCRQTSSDHCQQPHVAAFQKLLPTNFLQSFLWSLSINFGDNIRSTYIVSKQIVTTQMFQNQAEVITNLIFLTSKNNSRFTNQEIPTWSVTGSLSLAKLAFPLTFA